MSEIDNKFSYRDSVSLKEYLESRLGAMDRAVQLASKIMDKRLDGMNEFREQINRIEGTLVTHKELDLILDRINKDKSSSYAIMISILSLVLGFVILVFKG